MYVRLWDHRVGSQFLRDIVQLFYFHIILITVIHIILLFYYNLFWDQNYRIISNLTSLSNLNTIYQITIILSKNKLIDYTLTSCHHCFKYFFDDNI